jgi:hypothetical protein
LYVSVACDEVHEGAGALTDEVRALFLKKNNLRQVKNLPGTLPLYRGMRVLLYSKECVRLQLMNGCLCHVEDIIFAEEEVRKLFALTGAAPDGAVGREGFDRLWDKLEEGGPRSRSGSSSHGAAGAANEALGLQADGCDTPPRPLRLITSHNNLSSLVPGGGEQSLPHDASHDSPQSLPRVGSHASLRKMSMGAGLPPGEVGGDARRDSVVNVATFEDMEAGFSTGKTGGFDAATYSSDQFIALVGGPEVLSRWQMLYCGGSQPVLNKLREVSGKYGVALRDEKFDW